MSKLTQVNKNKKKQSQFEKLWEHVEKLKAEIAQRDEQLEILVGRVQTEIIPVERACTVMQVPLLFKLLDFGQRKSWANWQRQELEDWVAELLPRMSALGLIDAQMEDAIARYDAFRVGVELDENDGAPLGEQLRRAVDARMEEEKQARAQWADEVKDARHELIDDMLDAMMDPRPVDLPEDQFDAKAHAERAHMQAQYDAERKTLRKELEEDFLSTFQEHIDTEFDDEFDDDDGFDDDDEGLDWRLGHRRPDPAQPEKTAQLDNAALQRMFRSTAAALHPDREADPVKREEKQKLMVELLAARKRRDVMTVLQLYQTHVTLGDALSRADEKKLISALQKQIAQLSAELEDYTPKTPMHNAAWAFYSPSKASIERAFSEHINAIKVQSESMQKIVGTLKSMRVLKPLLEERYQARLFHRFAEYGDDDIYF